MLPLSVGIQIARQSAASTLSIFQTALCVVDHGANPAQTENDSGSKPADPHNDNPATGCPLCLALQVMHAFTDTLAMIVPVPSRVGKSLVVITHDTTTPVGQTASYQSRAPPVMA